MSRPTEVEWTMKHAIAGDSVAPWEDLRTLAKYVEQLEKEIEEINSGKRVVLPKNVEHAKAMLLVALPLLPKDY